MITASTSMLPVLIIIRGLPGSGKSYLALEVQKLLGNDVVSLLDPDKIDYSGDNYKAFSASLGAEGIDKKLHPYRFLRSNGYAGIVDHKVIIWNQAFTHLDLLDRTIKNLQAYALDHNTQLPALVVEVEADLSTIKERVAKREAAGEHGVSDEVFDRFINDYKTFDEYDYPILKVDGKGDAAAAAEKIRLELNKLRNV